SAENLALLVEAEAREGPGEVRAGRGLDAPGLQREAAAGTADEPVGADTDTEARFARGADIGARERALLHVMPLHGEDQPLDMRALGKANVEADLGDRALIDFGLVALAIELAGHVLLRADDVADAGIDFAGEAPDLDAMIICGGRDGGGCKNGCGKGRGGKLLHNWYPQVDHPTGARISMFLALVQAETLGLRGFRGPTRHPFPSKPQTKTPSRTGTARLTYSRRPLRGARVPRSRRQGHPRAGRACAPACEHAGWPRPSDAPSFRTASRSSSEASSRGTRPRAEASFSAHAAPGPHCYR